MIGRERTNSDGGVQVAVPVTIVPRTQCPIFSVATQAISTTHWMEVAHESLVQGVKGVEQGRYHNTYMSET